MPPLCRMPWSQSARFRSTVSQGYVQTLVRTSLHINDTSSGVHLRSSLPMAPLLDVHDPIPWNRAAQGGLASARASRCRGASPHLQRSFVTHGRSCLTAFPAPLEAERKLSRNVPWNSGPWNSGLFWWSYRPRSGRRGDFAIVVRNRGYPPDGGVCGLFSCLLTVFSHVFSVFSVFSGVFSVFSGVFSVFSGVFSVFSSDDPGVFTLFSGLFPWLFEKSENLA